MGRRKMINVSVGSTREPATGPDRKRGRERRITSKRAAARSIFFSGGGGPMQITRTPATRGWCGGNPLARSVAANFRDYDCAAAAVAGGGLVPGAAPGDYPNRAS